MKKFFKHTALVALISVAMFSTANAAPRGGIGVQQGTTAKILNGPDLITITAPDFSQCTNQVNIYLMNNPTAILFTPCG